MTPVPSFRALLVVHREEATVDALTLRLELAGVSVDELERALPVDSNLPPASRPENELAPIAVALIAEEVRARLIYLAGIASARRYEAISADARVRPIAEIARDLGISRQAVSRIVNQTRHERTLSDNNRLTGGAR